MQRRDFVRNLLSLLFASRLARAQQQPSPSSLPAPAPVPWTLGLNPLTPLPHTVPPDSAAQPVAAFFSARQTETLTRLSDVLMPALNGRPGAVQAGTPQFLDFLVGSSSDDKKDLYTGGLDWLDAQAHEKYQMPFAKLNDDQAGAILKPWLRTWMSLHPPTERNADFINIAHDDIRLATTNSEAWAEAVPLTPAPSTGSSARSGTGLYWSPIEPDGLRAGDGCRQAHVMAAAASNSMPTYSR